MIIKTFRKFIRVNEQFDSPAILSVFAQIDAAFANPFKVLKDDLTSTVIVITISNQQFVIKRANTKSVIHVFRRALKISRAQKNWDNAHRLDNAGIPAIQAVAMMEEKWGFLKGRSYIICPFIEGTDAREFFAHNAQPNVDWPIVAQNICTMIQKLAQNQISHRDLNLSNILLVDHMPYLLDLDAMNHYRISWVAKWAAKKERQRFMRNWQQIPKTHASAAKLFRKLLI